MVTLGDLDEVNPLVRWGVRPADEEEVTDCYVVVRSGRHAVRILVARRKRANPPTDVGEVALKLALGVEVAGEKKRRSRKLLVYTQWSTELDDVLRLTLSAERFSSCPGGMKILTKSPTCNERSERPCLLRVSARFSRM